ncbi:hypothetical protein PGT21_037245 [Puccinia graminis f. sp. tritici]|uniref:Uncharacterized protein n=1 Tax=Puccinia graminis f. sp. tritici TaxID=56615 RepID=A0A5B0R3W7_PUCGR|nr:hypothetical protein PGTUg99_019471 [Puccinia graminis f. sp. tritici]KAA1120188.1 hypothetical protein PGT21_037245 [Puccinia graminis f. sp. tritici]
MNPQPTIRRLSLTGSKYQSKPILRWIWLLMATGTVVTMLHFTSNKSHQHAPVSSVANQRAGQPLESPLPSDFEDTLKLITDHFKVHGHIGSSIKLIKRSPQGPATITENPDATTVNVTKGNAPLVIYVEDAKDSTTHVVTIVSVLIAPLQKK